MEISLDKVRNCRRYFSYIGTVLLPTGTYNHQILLAHNSLSFQVTMDTSVAIALVSFYELLSDVFSKIFIFIWYFQSTILVTVAAFSNVKCSKQLLQLIFVSQGVNHFSFFSIR